VIQFIGVKWSITVSDVEEARLDLDKTWRAWRRPQIMISICKRHMSNGHTRRSEASCCLIGMLLCIMLSFNAVCIKRHLAANFWQKQALMSLWAILKFEFSKQCDIFFRYNNSCFIYRNSMKIIRACSSSKTFFSRGTVSKTCDNEGMRSCESSLTHNE